ncbi:hypothetical protein [Acinetobacter sp. ANC 3832]|uniref:hypothetical protein n=1 Tax=Acinetobacter sp. ANC 3832 TaxID=1977874 RepID=UPI00111C48A4|nr:hypothetical protein [Acinetobacter sp. ANC 3832]
MTGLVKYLDADTTSSILATLVKSSLGLDIRNNDKDSDKDEEINKLIKESQRQKEIIIQKEIDQFDDIKKLKYSTVIRLKSHLDDLNRKANLNLVSGLTFCLLGLGFIFYSLIAYTPSNPPNLNNTLIYFLPRISLTILIEVFSYFFLNLYRKNLEDIKYFQNEVTNLESQYLAILYAFEQNNGQVKAKVIETLMNTERNFILKKDETTLDLERNRIDAQSSSNTVQALKDIINFKR